MCGWPYPAQYFIYFSCGLEPLAAQFTQITLRFTRNQPIWDNNLFSRKKRWERHNFFYRVEKITYIFSDKKINFVAFSVAAGQRGFVFVLSLLSFPDAGVTSTEIHNHFFKQLSNDQKANLETLLKWSPTMQPSECVCVKPEFLKWWINFLRGKKFSKLTWPCVLK